jgi:uncharacterized protein YecT (DUF1311 family)
LALAGLLAGPAPAPAQETKARPDAARAAAATEALQEARRKLRQAQDLLDAVVNLARARINARGDLKALQRNEWLSALARSQQQWATYRDTDCDQLLNRERGLEPVPTAESLACKTAKAHARADELKARYK